MDLLEKYKELRTKINSVKDDEEATEYIKSIAGLAGEIATFAGTVTEPNNQTQVNPVSNDGLSKAATALPAASTALPAAATAPHKQSVINSQTQTTSYQEAKTKMIEAAKGIVPVINDLNQYTEQDYTWCTKPEPTLPECIKNAFLLLFYRSIELKTLDETLVKDTKTAIDEEKRKKYKDYFKKRVVVNLDNIVNKDNYKTIDYSIVFPDCIKKVAGKIIETIESLIKLIIFYETIKKGIYTEYVKPNEKSKALNIFFDTTNSKDIKFKFDEIYTLIKDVYFILNKSILYLKFLLETTNIILIRKYNLLREVLSNLKKYRVSYKSNELNLQELENQIKEELKIYRDIFYGDDSIEDKDKDIYKNFIDRFRKVLLDKNNVIQKNIDALFNPVNLETFSIDMTLVKGLPNYKRLDYSKFMNNYKNFIIQDIQDINSGKLFPMDNYKDLIAKIEDVHLEHVHLEDIYIDKEYSKTFSKKIYKKISKIMLYVFIEKNIMYKNSDFLKGGDIDFSTFYNSSLISSKSTSMPQKISNIFNRLYYIFRELKTIGKINEIDKSKNKLTFITSEILRNFLMTNPEKEGNGIKDYEKKTSLKTYNIDNSNFKQKNYTPYKNYFSRGGYLKNRTRKNKKNIR